MSEAGETHSPSPSISAPASTSKLLYRSGIMKGVPTPSRPLQRPSQLLLLQSSHKTSLHDSSHSVVATVPPLSTFRNKFDFDAPQFADFNKPHYRKQKKILDKLVMGLVPDPNDQEESDTMDGSTWLVSQITNDENPHGSSHFEPPSEEDSTWFDRSHHEHEPSTPVSPAGPLITPQSSSARTSGRNYLRGEQLTPSSASRHSGIKTSYLYSSGSSVISGIRHANDRPRKKALRVPRTIPCQPSSSLNSPASSGGPLERRITGSTAARTSLATSLFSENSFEKLSIGEAVRGSASSLASFIKSPTTTISLARRRRMASDTNTQWDVSMTRINPHNNMAPSTPTPLRWGGEPQIEDGFIDVMSIKGKEQNGAPLRSSSSQAPIPSTNWSSIPATPPLLAAHLLFYEEEQTKKDKMEVNTMGEFKGSPNTIPPEGSKRVQPPLTTSSKPIRNGILGGGASRVLRNPTVPLMESQGNSNTAVISATTNEFAGPRVSPVKRVKVDARFCPAPPIQSRSRPPSPPPPPAPKNHHAAPTGIVAKKKAVKLDELKRLLVNHNEKLRPQHKHHSNITRRRF